MHTERQKPDRLTTMFVNGVETEIRPGETYPDAQLVETERLPIRHSCELREDKAVDFRAAVYVDPEGARGPMSVPQAIRGGVVDSEKLRGATVFATSPEFSAVVVNGGEYAVEDCEIALLSASDGKKVCDFVGLGSAVAAYDGAVVRVRGSEIQTRGVAKCALFADTGASVIAEDCRLQVPGGELYEGYVSNADFNYMVAPPWVLGIMGSARGTNQLGEKSSMAFIRCDVEAANWGVISTDNGSGMALTVVDSTLTLTGRPDEKEKNPYFRKYGSGYGTYILGTDEQFYGVTMNVGTYIGIARDGDATYQSSRGVIRHVSPLTGQVLWEGEGRGRPCVLNSDGFGIMTHGFSTLRLLDRTVMNTADASFLLRSGGVRIEVKDGTELNTASGVILQAIDDDDALVGVDWESDVELEFKTDFYEKAGWPSENGQISSRMPPPPPPPFEPEEGEDAPPPPQFDIHFRAENTVLTGGLYNGTGYYGQKAKQLYVTLGRGAVLNGAVSATETIHVNEKGEQNTHFTSEQYYYLGKVKNRNYYNGDNDTEVVLEAGAVWNVTGEGILSALTVQPGAALNGVVTVDGAELVPEPGAAYRGDIRVRPAAV